MTSLVKLTVFPVQGLDLPVEIRREILVVLYTLPAWDGDLDHTDLSDEMRIGVQEVF